MNQLNFEVEKWDTSSNSYVWVQVPALTDATTTIWAFWGKATNAPPCITNGATWSNAFLGVWHMATNTSSMTDSSTNRCGTATPTGTISMAPTGVVDGADDFTPQANMTSSNTFPALSGPYTFSVWVNMRSNAAANMAIMSTFNNGSGFGFILGLWGTTRQLEFIDNAAYRLSGFYMPTGTWQHVAFTRNSTNGVFYVNGAVVQRITNAASCTAAGSLQIGADTTWDNTKGFDGRIDEARVSTVDRSSNWMWTCYRNMSSSSFNSYGAPDNGGRPIIVNSNVAGLGPAITVNGYLSSTGLAANTSVTLFWGPTDGGATFAGWANTNTFPQPVSVGAISTNVNIIPGYTYYYRYYATNSLGFSWADPVSNFVGGTVAPIVANSNAVSTLGSATLNGYLSYTGAASVTAAVFWGPNDGGTNLGSSTWANTNWFTPGPLPIGVLATNVSVNPGVTYFYRFFATNSLGYSWANPASNFYAPENLTLWQKRMLITFTNYNRAEILTNFPALVILSNTTAGAGFNYADFLSPPHGDLRFVAADGVTKLNFEVETWNTNGNSYVWVQVPSLTNNAQVWMFWSLATNALTYTTNGSTWANGYLGVWHMATNTSAMTDSSTNQFGS